MTRRYFRPIKQKTIVDTLHYIRQEMVREEREGLDHVDFLLRSYGAEPMTLNMPRKTPKVFAKGELKRMVLASFRTGPKTGPEVARIVHGQRPDLGYKQVYNRVYICLWTVTKAGLLVKDEDRWKVSNNGF